MNKILEKKEPWQVVFKDRFLKSDKRENPYLVAFLYFLVIVLCIIFVFIAFFQLCLIEGSSMRNTLQSGEHVLLLKTTSVDYKDIAVITKKDSKGVNYNIIKRVIGVGGDTLEYKTENGVINLYRKEKGASNFTLLKEDYILEPMELDYFWKKNKPDSGPFTIEDGFVYVLGDNRNNSEDSRGSDGAYMVENVYGKMVFKLETDSLLEHFLKFIYGSEKPITKE